VVLSADEVESYRKRSPSQKGSPSGPWLTDPEAMYCKTAIRRLAKYLPMSIDYVETALSVDGAVIKPEDYSMDQSGELINIENIEEAETVDETTGEVNG